LNIFWALAVADIMIVL